MPQCRAPVQGFLGGRGWAPPSFWHAGPQLLPALPPSVSAGQTPGSGRSIWLPGCLRGKEGAECCGAGRGGPQQPSGTTSTELTAAAAPALPQVRGPARLYSAEAPVGPGVAAALHQEAHSPLPLWPTLGDLACREGGLWAAPPALGRREKVLPLWELLGGLVGRQPADSALNGLQTRTSPEPMATSASAGVLTACGLRPAGRLAAVSPSPSPSPRAADGVGGQGGGDTLACASPASPCPILPARAA